MEIETNGQINSYIDGIMKREKGGKLADRQMGKRTVGYTDS
jgi:hypothetical protein